jgi:hypothetical protein
VSRVPCLVSRVPCPVSRVPYLVSRVPYLVSRVPCLVSRVSRLVSRVSCPVSRVSPPYRGGVDPPLRPAAGELGEATGVGCWRCPREFTAWRAAVGVFDDFGGCRCLSQVDSGGGWGEPWAACGDVIAASRAQAHRRDRERHQPPCAASGQRRPRTPRASPPPPPLFSCYGCGWR